MRPSSSRERPATCRLLIAWTITPAATVTATRRAVDRFTGCGGAACVPVRDRDEACRTAHHGVLDRHTARSTAPRSHARWPRTLARRGISSRRLWQPLCSHARSTLMLNALVADDDRVTAELLAHHLRRWEFDVRIVSDGGEGGG